MVNHQKSMFNWGRRGSGGCYSIFLIYHILFIFSSKDDEDKDGDDPEKKKMLEKLSGECFYLFYFKNHSNVSKSVGVSESAI